jgi:hypothetical protein
MNLGVCSCIAGQDGSPCSHQAAIVKLFKIPSVNCVPSQSPETRKILAEIAVRLWIRPSILLSISDKAVENSVGEQDTLDFSGSAWNLVHAESRASDTESVESIDVEKEFKSLLLIFQLE